MIIRLYSGDSDFSHYLVDFCIGIEYYTQKRNGFTLLDNMFTADVDVDYFRRCDDEEYTRIRNEVKNANTKREHILGGTYKKWKKSDPEYQDIVIEVQRQFDIYCKDNNITPFPIDVNIKYSVSEKDENGEAVYYFTRTSQCIVM